LLRWRAIVLLRRLLPPRHLPQRRWLRLRRPHHRPPTRLPRATPASRPSPAARSALAWPRRPRRVAVPCHPAPPPRAPV